MARIGPNRTLVDKMDEVGRNGPNWTKLDQRGENGLNRTNMDWTRLLNIYHF